jgi:four helix bundle protein
MAANDPFPCALDHERLEVYRVALELHVLAASLVGGRGFGVIRDQIERASLGVVLNIAEGAGRRSVADKRRFFEIARGSATETGAALHVLWLRGIGDRERLREGRSLAIRVTQMLTRLCAVTR